MTNTIPKFDHSLITRDERGVYTLQIHNAKSLNIISTAVAIDLTRAAKWIGTQEDARAVIIRGSGEKAFIGGANIFEMAELDPETARVFITNLRLLCEAVAAIPVPTIARLNGLCLGVGMELAAACDIRLASADATFGMPEVRIGIPSVIHAVLFPTLIGPGATNWLLITGEMIDARQALDWKYVQFVAKEGEIDQLVERTITPIVASGPNAIRDQKTLLQYWRESSIEAGLDRSVDIFGQSFRTNEPAKYMAPFLARKKPEAK